MFQVCTEGRLILEFTFDDLMRIKSWHLAVRAHRELIPRQAVHPPDHAALDQLSKNITRQGITNSTLNYLRVSVVPRDHVVYHARLCTRPTTGRVCSDQGTGT